MTDLAEAMAAVVRAHAVLADFHREVAAFMGIMDDLLAPDGDVQLVSHNGEYIFIQYGGKFSHAEYWAPGWYARFYKDREVHPLDEQPEADPASLPKLAMAFIAIAAAPVALEELTDAKGPECVAGIAHPGKNGRAKNFWHAAKDGVYELLPYAQVRLDAWSEGKFQEGLNVFGSSSYWCARRFPLVELPDREAIKSRIADPLLERFAAKFKV